ncbi:sodium-dependent transporter, partial [Haloplanus ruber]
MARETWGTRTGFILAAAGSAVGLGNIWRFPWMTAENGGSAFLLVYLVIVLAVGVPGLLGEFVIGRRARR